MRLTLCIALPLAALAPFAAYAADYDPPIVVEEVDEFVPVEVGSGWYLRGDVGYAFSHPFEQEVRAAGTESVFSDSSLFTGSVGMGYHFNDFFRGELNLGILPTNELGNDELVDDACAGSTNAIVDPGPPPVIGLVPATQDCVVTNYAENKGYALMANAYVDLGTYVGITPYIGGGLGVSYNKYYKSVGGRDCVATPPGPSGEGGFVCNDPAGYGGEVDSEASYNLAYSLGAGLSYRITKNVSVDFGYEYMAVPKAEYVAYDDGAFGIHEGIDYHTVKLGFRYDLW